MNMRMMYAPHIDYRSVVEKDKYSKRNGGKARWLQNILFKILDWLEAWHEFDELFVTRIEINTSNLHQAIWEQMNSITNCTGDNCKTIIIGDPAYRKMMDSDIGHTLSYTVGSHGEHAPQELMGMKVIFVPWFDGALCLTEELA